MAERKYQFERLTPIDNMDLDVYEEAIDYVFDNSDIKNVAISGAYSAGKSSVLASYKKNHSNLRFLHISLAHFKSPDQEDETEIKESVLEGKILNQLIHQIPSEKIPQTNFRVKKKVNTKSVIRLTIGAVLFLVSTIYFFCFDMWKNYLSSLPDNWFKTILTPSTHQYALMVDGVLMVALLSFVVYRLISVQKNKNIFRKLNLNGNEIEIFEESDDSYFDKYLNEVLYLFENADADVIVFEDMDRHLLLSCCGFFYDRFDQFLKIHQAHPYDVLLVAFACHIFEQQHFRRCQNSETKTFSQYRNHKKAMRKRLGTCSMSLCRHQLCFFCNCGLTTTVRFFPSVR